MVESKGFVVRPIISSGYFDAPAVQNAAKCRTPRANAREEGGERLTSPLDLGRQLHRPAAGGVTSARMQAVGSIALDALPPAVEERPGDPHFVAGGAHA
jgi:hypothetical protein